MEKEYLRKLIAEHQTINEISEITGINKRNVRYYVEKYEFKTDNVSKKWLKKNFAPIVSVSLNYSEISRYMGLSETGGTHRAIKKYIKKYGLSISHFKIVNKNVEKPNSEIFVKNSKTNNSQLRRRIFRDNLINYQCQSCGNNGTWMNKKISLHLDHINGDRFDNRLENLRFLCPNCHQQTDTWGINNLSEAYKKHKKELLLKKREKICKNCKKVFSSKGNKYFCSVKCNASYNSNIPPKEDLINQIAHFNCVFTSIGKHYNVSDNAVRKWCKKYNIPHKSKEIKQWIKNNQNHHL